MECRPKAHLTRRTAAAEAEAARHSKKDVTGISFDLYKAFDRSPRTQIYAPAIKPGMPPKVLLTYHNYIENLWARDALALGIGQANKKVLSIRHGCPLNMMWLGVLTSPWATQIKALGGVPKRMADDLPVSKYCPNTTKPNFYHWLHGHIQVGT